MRLKDKVAIITGGGSGIGRASAELFAREGAKVVVADFNEKAGQETVTAIRQAGGEAIFVQVDVSDSVQVQRLVDTTLRAYGGIDILVNNAGILLFGTALDTSQQDWERVIAVNLTGTFLVSKAVLPYMIARGGGSIVNLTSSTGAHDAAANTVAYVTSKGGVALLTRAMAIDHAKHNVRVNAVAPGPTDTPMLRDAMSPEQLSAFAATFPMGRLGRPEELARAILFLASDEASFITGAILAVDGGQTAQV
ncbi:MAG: short-chain dehydrogenase [Ardenticatenia bacterium]|nr:MAG: short-chain dehydrogenase [Ardenticatenia bacterium]